MKNCFLILIFPAQGQPNGPLCIGAGLCISGLVWIMIDLLAVEVGSGYLTLMSDEALYRTLDYTISYLASGVSVSYLQKCQLYEAL